MTGLDELQDIDELYVEEVSASGLLVSYLRICANGPDIRPFRLPHQRFQRRRHWCQMGPRKTALPQVIRMLQSVVSEVL